MESKNLMQRKYGDYGGESNKRIMTLMMRSFKLLTVSDLVRAIKGKNSVGGE
jgi:hypothetical protein